MISPQCKRQISSYCQELGLSYSSFVDNWRKRIKDIVSRHIGINRFERIVKDASKEVEVLRWFMTVYLQHGYVLYLLESSIENKTAYMDCAIKLIYMA